MSRQPSIQPADHGIEGHFRHWSGDQAEDYNGPFFFHMEAGVAQSRFRVRPHNCNGHGTAHGGVLMMFADYTLCIAAIGGGDDRVVTVSCNSEFIAPVAEGALVCGRGEVIRRGGSLIFVRVTLTVDDSVVLTSSGVVKLLRQRP